METSVRESERVVRCEPEDLRDGFGRLEEDMLCGFVGYANGWYKVLG